MKFSLDNKDAGLSSHKASELIKVAADLLTEEECQAEIAKLRESGTLLSTCQTEVLKTIVYLHYGLEALKAYLHLQKTCPHPSTPKTQIEQEIQFGRVIEEAQVSNAFKDQLGDSELKRFLTEPEQKILSGVKQAFISFDEHDYPETAFADKVTSMKVVWKSLNKDNKLGFLEFTRKLKNNEISLTPYAKTKSPVECSAFRTNTAKLPAAERTLSPLELAKPVTTIKSSPAFWTVISNLLNLQKPAELNKICSIQ